MISKKIKSVLFITVILTVLTTLTLTSAYIIPRIRTDSVRVSIESQEEWQVEFYSSYKSTETFIPITAKSTDHYEVKHITLVLGLSNVKGTNVSVFKENTWININVVFKGLDELVLDGTIDDEIKSSEISKLDFYYVGTTIKYSELIDNDQLPTRDDYEVNSVLTPYDFSTNHFITTNDYNPKFVFIVTLNSPLEAAYHKDETLDLSFEINIL